MAAEPVLDQGQPVQAGADIVRLFPETLFERAEIVLPLTPRSVPPPVPCRATACTRTGWTMYSVAPLSVDMPMAADPDQLFLAFPSASETVAPMILPACAAFMSASIRSIFRQTLAHQHAARRLMRQDILYLGDFAGFSREEIIARLGPYCGLIEDIQATLTDLGLGFATSALWWRRPAHYYQRTR